MFHTIKTLELRSYSREYIPQMRGRRTLTGDEAATLVGPVGNGLPDWAAIFGRDAPLEVDLGCGDGTFLVAMAQSYPERNFVGLERMAGRLRSVCRKVISHSLPNVRVVAADLPKGISSFFDRETVAVFHFLFPDPWPKRRHWPRRTFNDDFLRCLARALQRDGLLHLATDHADYFVAMQRVLQNFEGRLTSKPLPSIEFPASAFEQKFQGRTIHRLFLQKKLPER